MAFKVPEKYRDLSLSSPDAGNNGLFFIPNASANKRLKIIASDGLGWEHVSVSNEYQCPSWEQMCDVKNLFWGDDEWVVQYHPPKSEYVNNHSNCLHLWRPLGEGIPLPTPPHVLVGFKDT